MMAVAACSSWATSRRTASPLSSWQGTRTKKRPSASVQIQLSPGPAVVDWKADHAAAAMRLSFGPRADGRALWGPAGPAGSPARMQAVANRREES